MSNSTYECVNRIRDASEVYVYITFGFKSYALKRHRSTYSETSKYRTFLVAQISSAIRGCTIFRGFVLWKECCFFHKTSPLFGVFRCLEVSVKGGFTV